MAYYLYNERYKSKNIPFDSIQENIYVFANDFLNTKGYHSNAFGKTAHLYDLFLWKKEEIKKYKVELVDDTVDVAVHVMDDFISTGWSHYATFGRSYASGWATREALFCVQSAYDLKSEDFKVSYLTHEGQHFSDYQKYPMLQQADLEYRAKLVELIKSTKTTLRIIQKFITNASNMPQNAHAFANYCAIRDLSKAIFREDYVTSKREWLSIDPKLIQEKSEMLFRRHTKQLDSIGHTIVTKVIQ